jgi:hypothetical protein
MIIRIDIDILGGKSYACIRDINRTILGDSVAPPDILEKMRGRTTAYFQASQGENGILYIEKEVDNSNW